jgi:hypothetical protein
VSEYAHLEVRRGHIPGAIAWLEILSFRIGYAATLSPGRSLRD